MNARYNIYNHLDNSLVTQHKGDIPPVGTRLLLTKFMDNENRTGVLVGVVAKVEWVMVCEYDKENHCYSEIDYCQVYLDVEKFVTSEGES